MFLLHTLCINATIPLHYATLTQSKASRLYPEQLFTQFSRRVQVQGLSDQLASRALGKTLVHTLWSLITPQHPVMVSFISVPLPWRERTFRESLNISAKPGKVYTRASRRMCVEMPDTETRVPQSAAESIIREMWGRCQTAEFTAWLPHFDESAVYHDTLYPSPFVGKSAIGKHLKDMETAIPPSIVFFLDDVAAGEDRVGARWHAETGDGVQVPFSRGASMYTFVRKDGKLLITEAWDFPETPFKLAAVILPVLRASSAILRLFDRNGSRNGKKDKT